MVYELGRFLGEDRLSSIQSGGTKGHVWGGWETGRRGGTNHDKGVVNEFKRYKKAMEVQKPKVANYPICKFIRILPVDTNRGRDMHYLRMACKSRQLKGL